MNLASSGSFAAYIIKLYSYLICLIGLFVLISIMFIYTKRVYFMFTITVIRTSSGGATVHVSQKI